MCTYCYFKHFAILFSTHAHTCTTTSFVQQWVFMGQLDKGEEFGLHRDEEALSKRGEAAILSVSQ